MLKIRLTRKGDKKAPFYRLIVADSHSRSDGRFVAQVGTYNPLTVPAEVKIDAEQAKQWMANGAQPTDTVRSLFMQQGIIPEKKAPAKTKVEKKKKD